MRQKRKSNIAWILIGIMLINLLPINLLADSQNPAQNLRIDKVGHKKDGVIDNAIIPRVQVEWTKPLENSGGGLDKHTPEYYQFEITDILAGGRPYLSERLDVNVGATSFTDDAGKYYFGADSYGNTNNTATRMANGKLYKLSVVPRHIHQASPPNGSTTVAPQTGKQEYRYVLTDFNTQMQEVDGSLEVTWEYVPGATYELVYIAADKATKAEIQGVTSGDTPRVIKQLTDSDVKDSIFTENGVQKVSYTIKDAKPGQIYSAYVEVVGINNPNYTGAFGEIKRNEAVDANGPKVVKAIPAMNLEISNIGKNLIEINWSNNAWTVLTDQLQRVLVYGKGASEESFTLKATKNNDTSSTIKSIIIDEPKEDTYYYIDFIFKDKLGNEYTIKSKIVLYTPYKLREQPLKPKVPKPWGSNIKLDENNKKDYLVTNDDRPTTDPNFKDNTFHANIGDKTNIQLIWDAPFKKDSSGKDILEHEMRYDIWVAEDKSVLDRNYQIEPIAKDISVPENQKDNIIYSWKEKKPIGFKWTLEQYLDMDGAVKDIVSNKTYYIKIVAKRPYGEEFSISQPTIVAITIDKNGDIFTPPVIGKPPLQLDSVTTTTATIKWLEVWHEILAKKPDLYTDQDENILANIGSAKVYIDQGADLPIRYKKSEGREERILLRQSDIDYVKSEVNKKRPNTYEEAYYDRLVRLGKDIRYELKVVNYNELEQQLGNKSIEQWIVDNESESTAGWNSINPTESIDKENLEWQYHTIEGLKPNTRYVMMVRAYRILEDGTKQMQTFPSYIIGTTMTDHESELPTPTVPVLNLDSKTDTSLSVWWTYNYDFDYEIVYSRKDNPDEAKVWNFEISHNPQDANYVADGGRAVIKINGLFPETSYNVWIRAKQKKGDKISAWSNPVRAKTDSLKVPAPPTGLGPAAYQSILDLGLDFKPIAHNYITVEWVKHPDDIGEQSEEGLEKTYEYELEFADNVEFLDSKVVTVSDDKVGSKEGQHEILAKNIVRFNKLISNRPYYVRVKTRIVLKDSETNLEIKKESEYTKWVRIITKTSDDEYDGGDNENIVIYPEDIVEDYDRGTWTIEIVNAQGIITQILNKKDYYLTIDAQLYNDRYDADIRKIRIPKSVLSALAGQRMELRVVTNIGKYEIRPQTLDYYIKKAEANDIVEFEFKRVLPYDAREVAKPYPYVMLNGETLNIFTKGNNAPLVKLDGYMKVSTKLPTQADLLYRSLDAYIYSNQSGTWIKQAKNVEQFNEENYLSYTTPLLGVYATYRVESYANENNMSDDMQTIANQYGVEALGNIYTTYSQVHSDQYVHLLLGIAKNSPSIALNREVLVDTKKQAKASGIYIENNSGYITEEQAISGIVKLYEMKIGYKVKPSSKKFPGVISKYSDNISKAYGLGIIENINPQRGISYETLCKWLVKAGF